MTGPMGGAGPTSESEGSSSGCDEEWANRCGGRSGPIMVREQDVHQVESEARRTSRRRVTATTNPGRTSGALQIKC